MILKKLSILALCIVLMCFGFVSCSSPKIPDITNVDEASAKAFLSSNGLIPAIIYEYSDEVATGCVIRCEPEIGASPPKNSVVTLYISKGPALKVPDIRFVDEEMAKTALTSIQLIPTIIYEYSDTVTVGHVTRTEPAIGSVVEPHSKIIVFLSYGSANVKASNVLMEVYDPVNVGYCEVYKTIDKIYVECNNFFISYNYDESIYSTEWYDPNDTGYISGTAWIDGKEIPIAAKYSIKSWGRDVLQSLTFVIPWSENTFEKPSYIDIVLNVIINGIQCERGIYLTISW